MAQRQLGSLDRDPCKQILKWRIVGGRLIEEDISAGTGGPWSSGNEKSWWRKGDQDGTLSLGSRWVVWKLWTDGGCDGNRMSGAAAY